MCPLASWASLAYWDLRNPQDHSKAFGSLGVWVRPRDLVSLPLLFPLHHPCSPSPPFSPEPLEPPLDLRNLLKPSAALKPQSCVWGSPPHAWGPGGPRGEGREGVRSTRGVRGMKWAMWWNFHYLIFLNRGLLCLKPHKPLSPRLLSLVRWVSLAAEDFPGDLGCLRNLPKPLTALGPQSDSGTFFPLVPLAPLLPLAPESPWPPGTSLGPQEATEAFQSLQQPWGLNQTQRPCSPCSPLPPLSSPPLSLPDPWDLPGALGSLRSLLKPSAALGLQSDWGTLFPLFPLFPLLPIASLSSSLSPHPLRLPGLLRPQKASGAFWSLQQPWGLSPDTATLLPLLPLAPSCPLSPPYFWASLAPGTFLEPQEASVTFWSLWQPWSLSQVC